MMNSSDEKPMLYFKIATNASSLAKVDYQQLHLPLLGLPCQNMCLLKPTMLAKFVIQWMALLPSVTSNHISSHY